MLSVLRTQASMTFHVFIFLYYLKIAVASCERLWSDFPLPWLRFWIQGSRFLDWLLNTSRELSLPKYLIHKEEKKKWLHPLLSSMSVNDEAGIFIRITDFSFRANKCYANNTNYLVNLKTNESLSLFCFAFIF